MEDENTQGKDSLSMETISKLLVPTMPFKIAPLMDVPICVSQELALDPGFMAIGATVGLSLGTQHPASFLEAMEITLNHLNIDEFNLGIPDVSEDTSFAKAYKSVKAWTTAAWQTLGDKRGVKRMCFQNSALVYGFMGPFLSRGYQLRIVLGKANFTGRAQGKKVIGKRVVHMWVEATNSEGETRILDVADKWYSGHQEFNCPSQAQIALLKELRAGNSPDMSINEMTEWLGALGNWASLASLGFNPVAGYFGVKMKMAAEEDQDYGGSFYA